MSSGRQIVQRVNYRGFIITVWCNFNSMVNFNCPGYSATVDPGPEDYWHPPIFSTFLNDGRTHWTIESAIRDGKDQIDDMRDNRDPDGVPF
jgi:hypothetical protein